MRDQDINALTKEFSQRLGESDKKIRDLTLQLKNAQNTAAAKPVVQVVKTSDAKYSDQFVTDLQQQIEQLKIEGKI